MEKVTHDAIPRRPVVTVAREVVGAEATALEHGLATVDTQTHGWTLRRLICTFITASSTSTRFTLGTTVVGRRLHRCGVRRGRGPRDSWGNPECPIRGLRSGHPREQERGDADDEPEACASEPSLRRVSSLPRRRLCTAAPRYAQRTPPVRRSFSRRPGSRIDRLTRNASGNGLQNSARGGFARC